MAKKKSNPEPQSPIPPDPKMLKGLLNTGLDISQYTEKIDQAYEVAVKSHNVLVAIHNRLGDIIEILSKK